MYYFISLSIIVYYHIVVHIICFHMFPYIILYYYMLSYLHYFISTYHIMYQLILLGAPGPGALCSQPVPWIRAHLNMTRRCHNQVLCAKDWDALSRPVALACTVTWCSSARTGRPGTSDRNAPRPDVPRLEPRALFRPAPSAPPSRAPCHQSPGQPQPWFVFVSGCYKTFFAWVQQPIPGHQAGGRRCCRKGEGCWLSTLRLIVGKSMRTA